MNSVHPGIPPARAFLIAFFGAVLGGILGAAIGYGYVHTVHPSSAGEALGALIGGVVAVVGCSILAVLGLRARSQWHRLTTAPDSVEHAESSE